MATYTQTKETLDAIAHKAGSLERQTENILDQVTRIEADLTKLQTDYSAFIAELNADAAANAGDPVWDNAKLEKDKIVTEFLALKARVATIKLAITDL